MRETLVGLVRGRKTQGTNGTVDIGGENGMTKTRPVIEAITMEARSTAGRSKGMDTRKGIEGADGLVALSRFRRPLGTAIAAQGTEPGKSGLLIKPETAGTASRDFSKMMSVGNSLQRRVGHYLRKPSHSQ